MALPLVLDPPPEVIQEPRTCWAASYESWSDANARLIGIDRSLDQAGLVQWFQDHPDLINSDSRINQLGYYALSCRGLMTLNRCSPSSVTVDLLAHHLESGYLYIIYQRATSTSSHCVVCWGADSKGIHLMDPWPGRGLIQREPPFFLQMQGGRGLVIIGTPGLVTLSRGLEEAIGALRPPPNHPL